MQTDPTTGFRCRACGTPVPEADSGAACQRCRYINLRLKDVEHRFHWLTEQHRGDSLEALFAGQMTEAVRRVEKDPAGASSLLIDRMARRESLLARKPGPRSVFRDGYGGLYNLATQLLYLLLSERGGVRLRSFRDRAATDYSEELWKRAFDAALLATRWLRQSGGDATFTISGGTLVERFTDTFTLALETQENSHRIEHAFRDTYPVLEEGELYEMQKAVLGFSSPDFTQLGANRFSALRELTTVQEWGPILAASLDDARGAAARLLEALTLSRRRVLGFRFPYYFDLGTRRSGSPPPTLPIETFALNWTSYYPCYEAHIEDTGPVALLSTMTFVNALAYILSSRSFMAAELEKRAKTIETPEAISVRGYQQKVSARLEQRIEDVLRSARFSTKANLGNIFAASSGEIDVIGARVRKKVTEIVLVEAKDFDMPLHKPGSFAIAVADLQRAAQRQLMPLTEVVRERWRSLLQELGVQPTNYVVLSPLLVTRRYMAPNLIPSCTLVPLNMLDSVLSRLEHRKLEPKDGLGALPRIVLHSDIARS